jgi:hypothetical protein
MTTKRKQESFIRGTAAHRRTESDYMGTLLETVTLDDWRDVVAGALQAAKGGDPAARAWLGQYLVGKPETKAPSALTVVVQQWSGGDPLAEKVGEADSFTGRNTQRARKRRLEGKRQGP